MRIWNINNFNPAMRSISNLQKVKITNSPTLSSKEVVSINFNKSKEKINLSSIIPNTLDSNVWYTINKNGTASVQSCWSPTSSEKTSPEFKALYEQIMKETNDGKKELPQERLREIKNQLSEGLKDAKPKPLFYI